MVVLTARALWLFDFHTRMRVHPSSARNCVVRLECQIGMAVFLCLPLILHPILGVPNCRLATRCPHDTCDTPKERYIDTLYTRYSQAEAQATQSSLVTNGITTTGSERESARSACTCYMHMHMHMHLGLDMSWAGSRSEGLRVKSGGHVDAVMGALCGVLARACIHGAILYPHRSPLGVLEDGDVLHKARHDVVHVA